MAVPWQCHGSAITVPKVSSGDSKATPRGCSEDFEASPRGVLGSSKEVESNSKVVEAWVISGCKLSKTHFWGLFFYDQKNIPVGFWDFLNYPKAEKMEKQKTWKNYNFCSARTGPDRKNGPGSPPTSWYIILVSPTNEKVPYIYIYIVLVLPARCRRPGTPVWVSGPVSG